MQPWKTLHRRILCQPNRFLTVELHELELPDGRHIDDWPWLITPDYANVLARTVDGRFLCFRQTKYAVKGTSLAPVGGFLEPGEDPLRAAQRELREETGYSAPQWQSLGRHVIDANRGAGAAHFFLALDAVPVGAPQPDDLEQQELLLLTHGELEEALDRGEFKVLALAAVVALGWKPALLHYRADCRLSSERATIRQIHGPRRALQNLTVVGQPLSNCHLLGTCFAVSRLQSPWSPQLPRSGRFSTRICRSYALPLPPSLRTCATFPAARPMPSKRPWPNWISRNGSSPASAGRADGRARR
jgi:ADP-ribose pyrophosphatase